MEAKKSPKADLEKKKGLFLEIGLVVILAITLVAFNIKSYDKEELIVSTITAEQEIEEEILNTQEDIPEPEPPAPETPEVVEIEIVENDVEIENEVEINADDNANSAQSEYVAPDIEDETEPVEETIFQIVEDQPEYPGGAAEMYKWLGENLKYPDLARNTNIEGKVMVSFVVEKDGSVSNVKVMRDIGGGCGAEAVRVVKSMPKWKPGRQMGKPVRTAYGIPVIFKLN